MRRQSTSGGGWFGPLLLLVLFAAAAWTLWVCCNIWSVGRIDQAQKADAIAVFGAAEYEGHPSPVLRARLQHTLDLYQKGIAPLIITLGGEGDMEHSEGGVGRSFLTAHGVPADAVVAETLSDTTEESVAQLAAIASARHLARIVVVSDATHLFRVRELCRAQGLQVFTSPRPAGKGVGHLEQLSRILHEVLSYTLWKLHIT
jgi:uncharacterized SAM-binding protein YcdF (DUF218 family)